MSDPTPGGFVNLPYTIEGDQPLSPENHNGREQSDETTVYRGRLTVVQHVYHQQVGEQPKGPVPSRWSRWLDEDEEAYTRTVKVNQEWQPLELGHTKGCSHLTLVNVLKRLPGLRPTKDEIEEFTSRVLEVGIALSIPHAGETVTGVHEIAEIPVGEDLRLSPLNLDNYRIRCRSGEGKYSIFLVPA